ncbi:cholesterol 7-desaturase-like [Oncorhynchus kisutch]|uniref:cholesterol 7-desaturase-like n=1 Tax=Oncorhynchus kisutch TaxID=8019 RepID=UPI00099F8B09|nr:cholesterol 7-desaturase-like [Oncorhynchus kisutch]
MTGGSVRGTEGKACVVDAYCPFLGANLAVGGHVVGQSIVCPFHSWQCRREDGKCVRIPMQRKVPCCPSMETSGQVLVWFHCDGEEPRWMVPKLTQGEWVYQGCTEHFINANIEEIPENAVDFAHLAHLHTPGIVTGVDLHYTNSKTLEFVRYDWKLRESESEPTKHCSQMLVAHALAVFGRHWPLLDVDVVARQLKHLFEWDVMIWNNKKDISKPLQVENSTIQKHRCWFSQFYRDNSPRLCNRTMDL